MKHTSETLTKMIRSREQQYQAHNEALKVRRGLMDFNLSSQIDETRLGTKLPVPFQASPLRMKIITGNATQAVNTLSAAIATNFPRPKVYPVSIHHERVGKRVKKQGAEQERLLLYLADELQAKVKQHQVERSATWGGVGYYFTLPRPAAVGLPPRTYYDNYSEAEREDAKRQGIEMEEVYEGESVRYAEPAASWLERCKESAKENWARAAEMFMLEAYPPDMVWPTFALEGSMLRAHITMEIPADDLKPGSEFAKAAGRYAKKMKEYDGDEGAYGLWLDGKDVKGGLPSGQEPGTGTTGKSWNLTIWADREEVYYLCGPQGSEGGGKIVWHDTHNGGICPIIPVPFIRTDSRQPGSEFATATDPVFRLHAIVNALWNQAVAGAGWNASPRYAETNVARSGDPETGEQTQAGVPGANPANSDVYEGDLMQITVKLEDVIALLDRAIAEMDKLMPSALLTGDAIGGGDTAWALQIQVGQIQQLYKQPVDNHADAWKAIWTLWVRWMKQLNLPVVAFPSSKQGEGLIEVDPEALTEAFTVVQDSADAQMQTIRQQMGIERWETGLIEDEQLFEDFFSSDDPNGDVLKARLQKLKNLILFGDTSKIQPGSALYKVAERVQGRLEQQAQQTSPNAAVAAAEQALVEAQQMAQQQAAQQQNAMIEASQPMATGGGSMPGAPGLNGRPTTLEGQLGQAAPVAAPMV